jgi:hypothetical protein
MKRRAILLTLVLLLLLTQVAVAMSSTNYRLDWLLPLTGGGGGQASSDNYSVYYTVGQTVVNDSYSASYAVHMGFWQQFAQIFVETIRLWLPLTAK